MDRVLNTVGRLDGNTCLAYGDRFFFSPAGQERQTKFHQGKKYLLQTRKQTWKGSPRECAGMLVILFKNRSTKISLN